MMDLKNALKNAGLVGSFGQVIGACNFQEEGCSQCDQSCSSCTGTCSSCSTCSTCSGACTTSTFGC